jgi:hypothetical protein
MSSKGLDRPLPSLIYQGDAIHDLRRVINMPLWDDYQEEVCEFFRNADMQAETNISVQGVRASHDIDVVVRSRLVGFELLWLVECKHWRRRVSKLHVLALREIVADVGADRGILMAEQGFQRGALDAARLTNVQLTSLANLANTAGHEIGLAKSYKNALTSVALDIGILIKRCVSSMVFQATGAKKGHSNPMW